MNKTNILRHLILLICVVVNVVVSNAATITYNDTDHNLCYTIDTDAGTAEVRGVCDESKTINNLVIPDDIEYDGAKYPVVSIAYVCFYRNTNIMGSLTIGNNVKLIDSDAFLGCTGLTGSLTIPNSVQSIGEGAFYGCSGFTGSLTIGESVQSIGASAFYGGNFDRITCESVTPPNCSDSYVFDFLQYSKPLYIPDEAADLYMAAEVWKEFRYVNKQVDLYNGQNNLSYIIDIDAETAEVIGVSDKSQPIGDLVIPDEIEYEGTTYPVVYIAAKAFYENSNLTCSLTIGNCVRTIGKGAFCNCSGFTGSLIIGNNVQTIGASAFYGCIGFTGSLEIPNSVQTIGAGAFHGCIGFTGSLEIPNSVQTIGEDAFSGCIGFTGSLTIGESVQSIGASAFNGCFGFTGSLTIGESVQSIGDMAFYLCARLAGPLTLPNSVQTIGEYAFDGVNFDRITCESVTPPNCSDSYVFDLTQYSKPLYVPDEYAELYMAAEVWKEFRYVNKQVDLYNGQNNLSYIVDIDAKTAEVIGVSDKSQPISNLVIPDEIEYEGTTYPVVYIAAKAFYENSNIMGSLTIGNNVSLIGERAFWCCDGFNESLTIGESVQTIGNFAFYNCSGFTGSLTIPNSVQTIGNYAFYDCSRITGSLTIGNRVETVGYGAFYACGGITGALTIPESVMEIGFGAFGDIQFDYVTCESVTPPSCIYSASNNFIFSSSQYEKPLYVPAKSFNLYKNATEWEKFTTITERELMGIDEVVSDNDIAIDVDAFGATIAGATGLIISCYTIDGRMAKMAKADSDYVRIALEKGIYIINVANFAKKVMIK